MSVIKWFLSVSFRRAVSALLLAGVLTTGAPAAACAQESAADPVFFSSAYEEAREETAWPPTAEEFPLSAGEGLLLTETLAEEYGIRTDLADYGTGEHIEILGASSGIETEDAVTIFRFLMRDMTLHKAAATGILANIYCESSFRYDALGDNGTSYGICQWHAGRWEKLKNYCDSNGYNWRSLNGQLHYLKYETEKDFPATMKAIRATTNDGDGAYESARLWCKNFEVPANYQTVSLKRGELARDTFWPVYKKYDFEAISPVPPTLEPLPEETEKLPDQVLPEDRPSDGVIPDGIWVAGIRDLDYTGTAQKQDFRVYDRTRMLIQGTDYTVAWRYNRNAVIDPSELPDDTVDKSRWPQVILTFKGSYKGTPKMTVPFAIRRISIDEAQLSAPQVTCNGRIQKPVPVCTLNGKKLQNRRDFIVTTYTDAEAAEAANGWRGPDAGHTEISLLIEGTGNYTGCARTTLLYAAGQTASEHPLPQVLLGRVAAKALPAQPYSGAEYQVRSVSDSDLHDKKGNPLPLSLTWKKKALTDADVTVLGVENGVLPGTATIRLKGKEAAESSTGCSFIGEKTLTFRITGTPLGKAKLSLDAKVFTCTGESITPAVTVTGIPGLTEDDFEVVYTNNRLPGTATATVTGRRGFTGSKKITFRIKGYPLNDAEITVRDADGNPVDDTHPLSIIYRKGGAKPALTVCRNGQLLRYGMDYIIQYRNNNRVAARNAKTPPTAAIIGKGFYAGTRNLRFTVETCPFAESIRAFAADKEASAAAGQYMQPPVVTDRYGTKLAAGTDYTAPKYYLLSEDKLIPLGKNDRPQTGDTIYIAFTGKGGYSSDTVYISYRII